MKNNKIVMIMLILLIAITLVGAVAIIIILNMSGNNKNNEPSIDEVLEASVDVPQITANLADDNYIRISFKIQTDSKKAKEELEKRDFQVKNTIILTLSEKTSKELKGKKGQLNLETELKNKLNEFMQEGKVEKVYITESLLQ